MVLSSIYQFLIDIIIQLENHYWNIKTSSLVILAVREGFEPPCRFRRTDFQSGRLNHLSHLTVGAP